MFTNVVLSVDLRFCTPSQL